MTFRDILKKSALDNTTSFASVNICSKKVVKNVDWTNRFVCTIVVKIHMLQSPFCNK